MVLICVLHLAFRLHHSGDGAASGSASDLHGAAVRQLQTAERQRRKCAEQWALLTRVAKKSALKLQIILTKFQVRQLF